MSLRRKSSLDKKYQRNERQSLIQTDKNYQINYLQCSCLYNIIANYDRTNLYIYNIEARVKVVRTLKFPKILGYWTCIVQLPNNKLFCYDEIYLDSGITLIFDKNFEFEVLPSGIPCLCSSGIYFNNNVYCFGGENHGKHLSLSRRFDLYGNRWIQLASMQSTNEPSNVIILFNGNILISGDRRNILLYSTDIDSFSVIPYEFSEYNSKILINGERLYLIECGDGSIYESEIGNEYIWGVIASAMIEFNTPQIYCSYYKEGVYIGILHYCHREKNYLAEYYEFDFNKKLIKQL